MICRLVLAILLVAGARAACAQQASLGISTTDSASDFGRQIGRRLVFICPPVDALVGDVWGSDVYADDSVICLAAIHAGVLPWRQAGLVAIVIHGAAASFQGSARNGVTS